MSWFPATVRFFERQFEKNLTTLFDALCRKQNQNRSPQDIVIEAVLSVVGPDPPAGIQPPVGSVGIAVALGLPQANAQAAAAANAQAAAAANSVVRGTVAAAGSVSSLITQPGLPPPPASSGVPGALRGILATAAGGGGIIASAVTNTALAAVSGAGRNLFPDHLRESGQGVLVPNELIRVLARATAAPGRVNNPSVSGGGGGVPPEVLSTVANTGSGANDLASDAALGDADWLQEILEATPSYFRNTSMAVAVILGVAATGGLAYLLRRRRAKKGGIPNLKKRKRSGEEDEEEDGGGNRHVKRGGSGSGGGDGGGGGDPVPVVAN